MLAGCDENADWNIGVASVVYVMSDVDADAKCEIAIRLSLAKRVS